MSQSNNFYSVTWQNNNEITYPPLYMICLALSYKLCGKNDIAPRIPNILYGIGVVYLTFLIGRLFFGRNSAELAAALLLVTPFFVANARGVLTEMPLLFWISLTFYWFFKGLKHAKWHLLLFLPLCAGLLTKSLLGMLPYFLIIIILIVDRQVRASTNFWLLLATFLVSIIIASSWFLYQWHYFGPETIYSHFGSIADRSSHESITFAGYFKKYFLDHTFWGSFIPLSVLGFFGVLLLGFEKGRVYNGELSPWILVIWWVGTLALYSFSSVSADRYIFPVMVPLAILGGNFIINVLPKVGKAVSRSIIPILCLLVATLFWFFPGVIESASVIDQLRLPTNENRVMLRANMKTELNGSKELPFFGKYDEKYWAAANSFQYYLGVRVQHRGGGAAELTKNQPSRFPNGFLVDRDIYEELLVKRNNFRVIGKGRLWLWIKFEKT